MKKIMFNDKYGLTEAVLNGRKTVTRRIARLDASDKKYLDEAFDQDFRSQVVADDRSRYKVGEIVAIAQSYGNLNKIPVQYFQHCLNAKGWSNKMFIKAELMPHQIQILGVYVESLQDITDEDCIKEGIIPQFRPQSMRTLFYYGDGKEEFDTPREAYASLIDKINGKGTWDRNPYVFRYEFKLLK